MFLKCCENCVKLCRCCELVVMDSSVQDHPGQLHSLCPLNVSLCQRFLQTTGNVSLALLEYPVHSCSALCVASAVFFFPSGKGTDVFHFFMPVILQQHLPVELSNELLSQQCENILSQGLYFSILDMAGKNFFLSHMKVKIEFKKITVVSHMKGNVMPILYYLKKNKS